MLAPTTLNMQKTMEEAMEVNKKIIKGIDTLLSMKDVEVAVTPKELVYEEDKMRLFHYLPKVKEVSAVPTLIVYALVNRQYMMDLQRDRSVISSWLDHGLDVYIIDWGYPDRTDRYLTMEDYIDGYIDRAVDTVRERSGQDKINILGVCQGGTFSTIYASLYPEKIKNLVTMVTPIDFSTKDGLLYIWSKHLNIDGMVDTYGVVPGDFMNIGFLMLKPFALMLDKYMGLLENLDNPDVVRDFLRMEKWIFDSPGQAGEAFRKFIKELFQENRLIQDKFELGGRKVRLKNITMPLLNVFAQQDHLVPPASSIPLNDAVGSQDKEMISFPGGHIGLYVSSKAQREVSPAVAKWLNDRSQPEKGKKKTKK
ncbi:MAG: class III poly(R)-hydroxyalkanoic acid synthase subunit PhaC [Clostridiales bacterium]|jgi:polyhydroxyalkanoate synthase|nr:class III poly(R)-hydroxyalkanoic acid synthase subunit PhaC [Clostridiales bacterium]